MVKEVTLIEVTLIEFFKNLLAACEKDSDIDIEYSSCKTKGKETVTLDFFHNGNIHSIKVDEDGEYKCIVDANGWENIGVENVEMPTNKR